MSANQTRNQNSNTNNANSSNTKGTQGGTHEQHVKAGQQSHKNDNKK